MLEALPRHGEIAPSITVVHLELAASTLPRGKSAKRKAPYARPTRACLCVGVEGCNKVASCRGKLARFGVPAVVNVHASNTSANEKADAVPLSRLKGGLHSIK